jgi:hypothetical protein
MSHSFSFFRAGGFNQVRFKSGADLLNIDQLDQKLWVALACPTTGLVFDARTLALIDSDGDGRIRANELIGAVKWAGKLLKNPDDLLKAPAELPLNAINADSDEGKLVLHAAKTVLEGLGKAGAPAISVAETADALKAFNAMRFNGDGVLPVESADSDDAKALITDILATVGGVDDRSGKPGVNAEKTAEFFKAAGEYVAWYDKAAADTALLPLQADTAAALDALNAVRAKIDDFFVRCELAAFDARAIAALNREEKEYFALAVKDLQITSDEIRCLPLAHIDSATPLPLKKGINPAWTGALDTFTAKVVKPLLGDISELTQAQWHDIKSRLGQFEAWQGAKAGAVVEKLGIERLRALAAPGGDQLLAPLFDKEKAQESTANAIASVERLVRYVRDLHALAINFVSFQQFYQRKSPAIFQVGTLYLDQRAAELCLRVEDVARHAVMAPLSRAYLVYCDCVRKATGEKMTIAAAFTNGDCDNLMVGRNGIFYDRDGKDWDATVTKLVENPISIRQAFWSPYKKLIRFIEEQVAKRAAAGEASSSTMLTGAADKVGTAATTGKADAVAPKKFDVGVVAALGVAVGGITAALGALLQAFFGLGFWMPLGVLGLVLLISGPSMLIAWLKLRQRNVGPILDANGWAVNAHARVNLPFGASLTRLAVLPKDATLDAVDPFAEKKRPWKLYGVLAVILVLGLCWFNGNLDGALPASLQKATVLGGDKVEAAAPASEPAAPPAPANP